MQIADWLDYLEQLNPHKIELGLGRCFEVANRLKLIEFKCPVVTVAGTNGKGSNVAFLEAIWQAAGYRTGAYISPHLLRFNERIRIAGKEIDDVNLCVAFVAIKQASQGIALTYFEFTTLAALWLFQRANLDVLILEVGLGGRLDAVNIVNADIAIIASVAIDHIDWLGDNRESIAKEKAGIFRPQQWAICGDVSPPHTLMEIAKELNTNLLCIGRDFSFTAKAIGWRWQMGNLILEDLPNPQLSLTNAATALAAVAKLQLQLPTSLQAIKVGLSHAFLPGRYQQLDQPVLTILDVAHNPAAANYLAQRLRGYHHRTFGVVGMLADKDIPGTLAELIALVDAWFVGSLLGPRGAPADKIIAALEALGAEKCYNHTSVVAAYKDAVSKAKPEDRIVVFGSFHTVAEVLAYIQV